MAKAFEENTMNGLASHAEDRRHGVDREHHVGGLHHDQHGEQRGGEALPVLLREQVLAVVLGGRRHHLAHRPQHDALVGVDLVLVVEGQLPGRVEEHDAEDRERDREASDERDAGEDEHRPQHERAEDAPEQRPELVLRGHREVAEDHRPDEHVVDRQALLEQEAGDVLAGRGPALVAADQEDDAGEGETDADPDRALDRRFLERDHVRLAVHDEQVEDQQQGDETRRAAHS